MPNVKYISLVAGKRGRHTLKMFLIVVNENLNQLNRYIYDRIKQLIQLTQASW